MKIKEFWKLHGLENATGEQRRQFFARNLSSDMEPVSVAWCPFCGEVLVNSYKCPNGCSFTGKDDFMEAEDAT